MSPGRGAALHVGALTVRPATGPGVPAEHERDGPRRHARLDLLLRPRAPQAALVEALRLVEQRGDLRRRDLIEPAHQPQQLRHVVERDGVGDAGSATMIARGAAASAAETAPSATPSTTSGASPRRCCAVRIAECYSGRLAFGRYSATPSARGSPPS